MTREESYRRLCIIAQRHRVLEMRQLRERSRRARRDQADSPGSIMDPIPGED